MNEASESHKSEQRKHLRLWVTVAAVPFLVVAFIASQFRFGESLEIPLDALALAVAAAPVLFDAAKRIKDHPFSADVLMSVAAVGAAAIGAWHEGAAVILLYNIAETVEDYTVDRVRNITKKMARLLPQRALLMKNGSPVEVSVDGLKVGDRIMVKPGWRIPVDGRIMVGRSSVDQSAVTGESVPVEKKPDSSVLSGTLNLDGSLELEVERRFQDSTVSRIVKLVMESHEKKARIEKFVDRFSRYYTPAMIGLAIAIAIIPPVILAEPFSVWIYRALIVLIVACPSALVISTPVTILLGLTRAMWNGILVKGGTYLEEMSRVRAVAFDKTGTLTLGRLRVARISPAKGYQENEVLRVAAIAESRTTHPIGTAIVEEAKRRRIEIAANVEINDYAGRGIKAAPTSGPSVLVGKLSYLAENGIALNDPSSETPQEGTVVGVAADGRLSGVIVVVDQLRPESKESLDALKKIGVERVVMLTGDTEAVAKKIAAELGVSDYYSELLPEAKVEIAKKLRQEYGSVAMVGDGINDAPVLAASNVGIALGTAGNDIAIEAADVALMGSDLRAVPYLIRLGRKVRRKLALNIGIALGLKFLVIGLGSLGLIPLWLAVIGDDGVTLLVIAHALPLLKFR